ncbi:MAG TPA: CBS domain-containing protein, partial [Streptomyces sp.]|nr:CBS domain-containing protein [Streptomyces sp.]
YGEGRIEQFDPPAKVLGAPATEYVADFVGADRGLKRLSVTPIERGDLVQPPVVHLDDPLEAARARMRSENSHWAVVLDDADALHGWLSAEAVGAPAAKAEADANPTVADHARRMEAWLPLGSPLKQAFSSMLQHDAGWIAVLDETDRFVGVLTPSRLHEALRRSIDADERDLRRDEVELETVAEA